MKAKIELANAVKSESDVFDPVHFWAAGNYTRKLIPDEDGGFTAEILEFPGCVAEGDTADEALSNLGSAAVAWIEAQHEQGQPIPRAIERYGYSGKVALRLPRGLHKTAAELAAVEGVSLNNFLTTAIALIAGQKNLLDEIRKELACASQPHYTINVPEFMFRSPLTTIGQGANRALTFNEPLLVEYAGTNDISHSRAKAVAHD